MAGEALGIGLVGLLADAQSRCLVLLCDKMNFDGEGLTVAAREAKRRGLVTGPMCKKLGRLDIAAHVARHFTRTRSQRFVENLSGLLRQGATGTIPGTISTTGRGPREPEEAEDVVECSTEDGGVTLFDTEIEEFSNTDIEYELVEDDAGLAEKNSSWITSTRRLGKRRWR